MMRVNWSSILSVTMGKHGLKVRQTKTVILNVLDRMVKVLYGELEFKFQTFYKNFATGSNENKQLQGPMNYNQLSSFLYIASIVQKKSILIAIRINLKCN